MHGEREREREKEKEREARAHTWRAQAERVGGWGRDIASEHIRCGGATL
jgi:hypothetical protein